MKVDWTVGFINLECTEYPLQLLPTVEINFRENLENHKKISAF